MVELSVCYATRRMCLNLPGKANILPHLVFFCEIDGEKGKFLWKLNIEHSSSRRYKDAADMAHDKAFCRKSCRLETIESTDCLHRETQCQ